MAPSETSSGQGRRSYVVYETGTGRIAHTVHVDVMRGARVPSDAEIEKQVMISASHVTGIAEGTLSFLLVDPARLRPGMVYNVNPKTHDLREEKASSPKAKRPPRKK